jgi:hypothetical protein
MERKMAKFYFMFLILFFFAGCSTNPSNEDFQKKPELNGYWKSSYGDGFEISNSSYNQYDDASKALSFSGDIVKNSGLVSVEGYLVIRITNPGSWGKTTGKYYIIRWKNFSGNKIMQSSAYKSGGYNDGLDTIESAESEYTEANGYFTIYPDYEKQ